MAKCNVLRVTRLELDNQAPVSLALEAGSLEHIRLGEVLTGKPCIVRRELSWELTQPESCTFSLGCSTTRLQAA